MAAHRREPKPLLERLLDKASPTFRELSAVYSEIAVQPAVAGRIEHHRARPRSDGLDEFFRGTERGVALVIPGEPQRLIPPRDGAVHVRWKTARANASDVLSVVATITSHVPGPLANRLTRLHQQLVPWTAGAALSLVSPAANAERIAQLGSELVRVLAECSETMPPAAPLRLIDTSALLDCPNPRAYGEGAFEFVLPRTALRELDELKHHDRAEKRDRARRALKRLHEWERRGRLLEGVTEDRNIRIRLLPQDAAMAGAPPDLNEAKADDRVLWTARELTFASPTSLVILVSGDSNLRARAELEQVETEPAPLC